MSSSDESRVYSARPVDRPRGVYDRLPPEREALAHLQEQLSQLVRKHDYRFIETPVIEHTDLFLRKSGGERLAQIYAFNHRGRELALRPEHTASVVRAYIENMQSDPLPVRLAYCGPVFRYESPQAGRSRQFTDFGCELIGAEGLLADAETIRLALDACRTAGIAIPHIVLGHIGIVSAFLAGLQIDQRAQDWLIWTMERLRDQQDADISIPDYLITPPAGMEGIESLEGLNQEGVIALLRQSGVRFEGGTRSPEEIVAGLLEQRQRRYDEALMNDALGFVRELTRLAGDPAEVMPGLRALVASRNLSDEPLNELEAIIDLLQIDGSEQVTVTIDLGMGRGLRYYTGMLFEIYAEQGGQQICGGGRYDDLAQVLGARSATAACGFSMGLERALSANPQRHAPESRRALVWSGDDPAAAINVAGKLRNEGWFAAVDPRKRSESAARRSAQRQGYDLFVRVTNGAEERIDLNRSGSEVQS